MRLSKEEREKLMKEAALYEQTCYFIIPFDPTDVLDLAYKNIDKVLHDLDVILFSSSSSSPVDDVSLMINEYRSKVEKELVYICDKSHDIETKQAFKEFLVHFKQGDLTKYRSKVYYSRYASLSDIISFNNGKGCTSKEKEKAPQLTKLERKQQNDDEEKSQVYLEKLNKEYNDYHATLRFMLSFLRKEQITNEEHRRLLIFAYMNIMDVSFDLRNFIKSKEVLCDTDVSLILSEYRSKVENELQGICDNVANLTVQEAYLRHLNDFKTRFKLSAQDHHSHLQNEKIMSSKPKMSVKKKKKKSKFRLRGKGGSGSCRTPLADLHINGYLRAPRHDHSKCCMKEDNLETSDWEWHRPILRIARESKYPRLNFPVCDDDSP